MHSAPGPPRHRCLPTGMTGSGPRSAPAGFGQIGEPPLNVSLTHEVVRHFSASTPPFFCFEELTIPSTLGAGMKMHMFHSDRLLIAAPMLVERLNQLKLKLDQSNSIAAPNIDVCVLLVTQTEV